jgi:hypothetical protein
MLLGPHEYTSTQRVIIVSTYKPTHMNTLDSSPKTSRIQDQDGPISGAHFSITLKQHKYMFGDHHDAEHGRSWEDISVSQ